MNNPTIQTQVNQPQGGATVQMACQKALTNLPNRLNTMWQTPRGKSFVTHLLLAYMQPRVASIFNIGNFSQYPKYAPEPKICALTGFAVADVTFSMDDVTRQYFTDKNKKVNKLVYNIPCIGSTQSTKILSVQALTILQQWFYAKAAEQNSPTSDFTVLRNRLEQE